MIVPNETELEVLCRSKIDPGDEESVCAGAEELIERGVCVVQLQHTTRESACSAPGQERRSCGEGVRGMSTFFSILCPGDLQQWPMVRGVGTITI